MPRKGHSEEKIVYALQQVEAGKKVSEVCREMGILPHATSAGLLACGPSTGCNKGRKNSSIPQLEAPLLQT